jgi:hypothetical protein
LSVLTYTYLYSIRIFMFPPIPNIQSILVGTYIYLFILFQYSFLPQSFPIYLLFYSQYSFYTCRYLHILIYIPS